MHNSKYSSSHVSLRCADQALQLLDKLEHFFSKNFWLIFFHACKNAHSMQSQSQERNHPGDFAGKSAFRERWDQQTCSGPSYALQDRGKVHGVTDTLA
jgi:hypothetical protein